MYPEAPTLAQWRAAAADRARVTGADIPANFDGSNAANQALTATARQTLTIAQNQFVLENSDQFPPQFTTSAKAYLNSAAPMADYTMQDTGVVSQGVDFVATLATQTPRDVLDYYGVETRDTAPAPSVGNLWLLAGVGVTLGAGIYYFSKKGA